MQPDFIPISQPSITQLEIDYATSAIKSGWISSAGENITKFENDFAEYCGTKYSVATSNGTTALHLTLVALGVGKGDEVIIPNLTFVATANAVSYCGAKVIFADIDKQTMCIDTKSVESLITSKTKAIIPVHLYGQPASMLEINRIAKPRGIIVIEDAAEAHGASINGRKVGGMSHAGVFSFFANKIITTGEGGAITTDDKKLYERLKFLRDHAMDSNKKYWHTDIGFNYRMTNIQAAIGIAQLSRIDEILDKKNKIFKWYCESLQGENRLILNTEKSFHSVYWMVCLRIDGISEDCRDNFIKFLKEKNIDSRPFFYPISDMPMYKDADTPVSSTVYKEGVNLPSFFDMTRDQVVYIANMVKLFLLRGVCDEN